MSRAPHSFAGVGGSSVSARWTRRLMNASGRVPNASSARRAVPNRLVTSGKSAPFTLVNSSAGPPAAITRRWISAASRLASTGARDLDEIAIAAELIEERSQRSPKTSTLNPTLPSRARCARRTSSSRCESPPSRSTGTVNTSARQHREVGEHADRELPFLLFLELREGRAGACTRSPPARASAPPSDSPDASSPP